MARENIFDDGAELKSLTEDEVRAILIARILGNPDDRLKELLDRDDNLAKKEPETK